MRTYYIPCPEGCEDGWWTVELPARHCAQIEPDWEMQRCGRCDGGLVELCIGQSEHGWWAELAGHEYADQCATLLDLLAAIMNWTHADDVLAALAGKEAA